MTGKLRLDPEVQATAQNQTGKNARAKKPKSDLARWLHRAIGAAFWAYLVYVNTSLFEQWPPPSLIEGFYAEAHRWLRWFLYTISLTILYKSLGLFKFLYLIFFPVWAVVLGIFYLFKISSKTLGVNQRILATTSSRRAGLVSYVVIPFCYLAVIDTSNPLVLVSASILLLVASLRIIFGVFRWVMRPLEKLAGFFEQQSEAFSKKDQEKLNKVQAAINRGDSKRARHELDSERYLLKVLVWIRSHIVTPRMLLGVFLIILGFTVLLVITNFGFIYYGLNKLSVVHFAGPSEQRSLWDFAYFSTMVMTTSDLSDLSPNSVFTELVSVMQLGCSLTLLSFLLFVFSTSGQIDLNVATIALTQFIRQRAETSRHLEALLREAKRREGMKRLALPPGET